MYHRGVVAISRRGHIWRPRSCFRSFHNTAQQNVAVGDRIPDGIDLVENSPGNKVLLAKELSRGRGLVIGVPAAFSPSCSEKHLPGYIAHCKLKDAGKVFVVSVNDPFVMNAWSKTVDPENKSGMRFLGDPSGNFTKALDLDFDASAIFGHPRSKRYALITEDGVVTEIHVEPDATGVDVSSARKVLG